MLISGWLIYPFAAIDLFSVDWKIPASYLQNDSDQIKVWGRCLYDVTKINDPVSAWFPVWWGEKDRYEMMLLIANMVAGFQQCCRLCGNESGKKSYAGIVSLCMQRF